MSHLSHTVPMCSADCPVIRPAVPADSHVICPADLSLQRYWRCKTISRLYRKDRECSTPRCGGLLESVKKTTVQPSRVYHTINKLTYDFASFAVLAMRLRVPRSASMCCNTNPSSRCIDAVLPSLFLSSPRAWTSGGARDEDPAADRES